MALKAAFILTRPAQWPILTAQFMVGVLLFFALQEPGESIADIAEGINWLPLGAGWLVWVVLLNGGTLAFNSAFDRDTSPIAYLRCPPDPPAHLGSAMLIVMTLGALLGWLAVSTSFGITVGTCVVLSFLYSHPLTRWKAIPGLDLLVNMTGYGSGTTLAGFLVGTAMLQTDFPTKGIFYIVGFGLLFGSLYPLTQIYQVKEDELRGDRTISSALGVKSALLLAIGLGFSASITLLAGVSYTAKEPYPIFLLIAVALWLMHLIWWRLRTETMSDAQHEQGMYRALALWALIDVALITEMLWR